MKYLDLNTVKNDSKRTKKRILSYETIKKDFYDQMAFL